MSDDWNDRFRSSNDYLDRRQAQSDFEIAQRKKADAVDDAIRNHDNVRARQELGITPPDPTDAGDESERQPTLQEQFEDCRTNLRCIFHMSEVLSEQTAEALIGKLREIDLAKPLPALDALRELRSTYEQTMERARQRRDIFAVSEEMRFSYEQEKASHELRVLDRIVSLAFNEALARAIEEGRSSR